MTYSVGPAYASIGVPSAPAPPPHVDTATKVAARIFLDRVSLEGLISEVLLYGSRARGDHSVHSDADLAIVFKGETGDRYKVSGEMAEIAFDIFLETGILVQAVPFWEGEWRHPNRFGNPALIAIIKSEGVRL